MKTASKIFYTVGRVINIIEIVFAVLAIILGAVCLAMSADIAAQAAADGLTVAQVKGAGLIFVVGGVISLIVALVIFLLANHASKALNNDTQENAPHIIMIVIGIFGDIFYLLGGIFGLIEESNHPTISD